MRCYLSITKAIGLAALLIQLATGAQAKTIINVDLYYETLCPDSMGFVGNQLVPAYPALKDHLNINFIPYGKASHSKVNPTGLWQFVCQHGPAECRGNIAQACGIHEIQSAVKSEAQQQLLVDLVGCVMTSKNPASAITLCVQQIGLSEESKNRVVACERNSLGNDLLASYGNITGALEPKISFVPTIVINGVYSKENQSQALRNFHALICQNIPDDEKPAVCGPPTN